MTTTKTLSPATWDRDAAIIRAIASDLRAELIAIARLAFHGHLTAAEASAALADVQAQLDSLWCAAAQLAEVEVAPTPSVLTTADYSWTSADR